MFVLGLSGLWLWIASPDKPPLLDDVPFSRLITDKQGRPLRLGLSSDETYRLRCRLDDIHPDLIRATLLYEDRWFYRHPGVNPLALARAFVETYVHGTRRMGGSTLTMQVARLRFKLHTASWQGKIRQILLALQLEIHYSKREILEAYFNLAPYGNNVEGAETAARIYFHIPAARLSTTEALALAVIPQNPGKRNPLHNQGNNPEQTLARERLASVWKNALSDEVGRAFAVPQLLTAPVQIFPPAALPFHAPHISTELLDMKGLPSLTRTTVDLRLQKALEHAVQGFTARHEAYGAANAAALLLHWPDMEIRALTGSADFHDIAIQGQVDISRARRSPGSTLKPFIYALALDQGIIHPMTLLADAPRSFKGYEPENMDQKFQGPIFAREALTRSRNIPAISLANQLNYPDLYTFLRRAGVDFAHSAEHYGLSLILGGAEVTMRELAALYAMLPNQGLWRPTRLVSGEDSPGIRMLSPEAALLTLDMLREPGGVRSGSGGDSQMLSVHVKTGTSNGYRDAWCAGIFGPYVLVVWLGNSDNKPNPVFVGRRLATPLFQDIATAIAKTEPVRNVLPSLPASTSVVRIPVCASTGDIDVSLCPGNTTETWFIPGVSPIVPTGVLRRILVDTESELRACRESISTEERVWEFWSGDMAAIFQRAGIYKAPPPDWMPGCSDYSLGSETTQQGLRITTPTSGITYYLSLSQPSRDPIPLEASAPADAKKFFWFAGNNVLGSTTPGHALLWTPPPGVTVLRVVDDKGRSAHLRFVAETVE